MGGCLGGNRFKGSKVQGFNGSTFKAFKGLRV